MRRIITVLAAAVLMAALLGATMAAAWAEPPAGGGGTGCEAGVTNAYLAIGTGAPSSENPLNPQTWPAPYRQQPLGEPAQGQGAGHGFNTSEEQTFLAPHCP